LVVVGMIGSLCSLCPSSQLGHWDLIVVTVEKALEWKDAD
jgi:hypothetical protein